MDYYLEGLRRDPTDLRLNNACGLYLLRHAQIEESVPYFRAAIRKQTWRNPNPYSGEAYFNLGLALEMLEKLPESYDAFFKATWSAETAGPAYLHLACICVKQGQLRQALTFAEESLLRGWHDMKARSLKAGILCALHTDSAEYQQFLEESLKIDPLYLSLLFRKNSGDDFARAAGGRVEDYLTAAYELLGFGFWEDACRVLTACPVSHPMISYALAYAEGKQGHAAPALSCVREAETLTTDLCFPSRVMEKLILDYAVSILPEAAKAHYYLGELLYDKKQYAAAIGHWETAVALLPSLAPAHRNLSIAYYNHGDRSLAEGEIAAACSLESGNSRFLLEQEQLLARLGRPVKERLALLEEQEDLLPDRYALMLAYVSLLNQAGKHEKALDLLMNYTFHVWEGGEGKVADEYKTALFALS